MAEVNTSSLDASQQVLHVDFVSLKPETTPAERDEIIEAARQLAEMPGVVSVGLIEGDAAPGYELAFCFVLPHFIAIEPFGTDTRYVRFLQGKIAPHLKAFAGADVQIGGALPDEATHAACLALELPDETYDWEVRERLASWAAASGGESVLGLAIGERQRYRGLVIVFAQTPKTATGHNEPGATLVTGRWQDLH